jgi:CheY-like chemotaxis protein
MAKQAYTVVIVDDDPFINELLSYLLVEAGYQVLCCFTGAEAARVIRRVVPDVAIVDMQMEVRDAGLQLLKAVRQDPQTAKLGVILCSADNLFLDAHRQEIVTYRGEIMPKPFNLDHLLDTVRQLLAPATSEREHGDSLD